MAEKRTSKSWRWSLAALAAAVVVLTGCGQVSGTKAGPGGLPITLTLVMPEVGNKMPYLPALRSFAADVDHLSGGAMHIALAPPPLPWHITTEVDLARSVAAGEVDLSLIPTRAYGALGLDAYLALETPFLVTSAAAGAAVERSPLASRMLRSLPRGTVGLALLFETIRQPAGYQGALATPADFAGKRLRVGSSVVIPKTLAALGAKPIAADDSSVGPDGVPLDGADTAMGWIQTVVSPGEVITVGLPLSAKFNTLVVSKSEWESLDPGQRDVLSRAAEHVHARDVVAEAAAQAAAFCQSGAHYVTLAPAERARFEALVAPVIAELSRDPVVASDIRKIRSIVAGTKDDTLPIECAPPSGDSAGWTP